ncbi:hypothetical protein ACOCEA_11635 [Maribacter sp. CXY002]|uniref:hypothetical protein n=1 Tax=Maribacter luteocoastalis TaxID=3407671 RepID=UPI003B683938
MKLKTTFTVLIILTFSTSTLSAQEITVFQGMWGDEFYQDKQKMTWKEFGLAMDSNTLSEEYWAKSKKQYSVTFAAATANLGFGIWYLISENNDDNTTASIVGFASTAVVGSIFYCLANKNKKNAILEFNDSLGKTSYRLVPSNSGLGLALSF